MTFIILLIIAFMIGYGIVLMKENISMVDEINRAITFNRGTKKLSSRATAYSL